MKNLMLLLFLFSAVSVTLFSQVAEATLPAANENSLLWTISGKDLAKPSYLYGTIHLIDKDDFFLTDSTKAFLDRAEKVTFEINMEDMTNIGAQFGLLMSAFMDNGQTLKGLLSEEDYQTVQNHFSKIGMPLFLFERMKPMFLTVLAGTDMSPDALSSGEMLSYEMEFLEMAKTKKKEIGGLETAEYQMSMFDSIPYDAQAKMLVESIKNAAGGSDEMDKMVELYKNQDIQGMQTMFADDEEGIARYEDLLLVTRNKNWIPVMGEMMKKQPTFFAVGAGHLGGKMGVIALLRQEGYTLSPVK